MSKKSATIHDFLYLVGLMAEVLRTFNHDREAVFALVDDPRERALYLDYVDDQMEHFRRHASMIQPVVALLIPKRGPRLLPVRDQLAFLRAHHDTLPDAFKVPPTHPRDTYRTSSPLPGDEMLGNSRIYGKKQLYNKIFQ